MIARPTALSAAATAALVAVPVALAAGLPGGAKYVGTTDDGSAVQLRVSSDSKRVAKMRIHYKVTCDNGDTGRTYTDILNPRLHSDGSFNGAGTYKGSGDGSTNKFKVVGQMTARKASGTFTLTAVGTPQGTTGTIRCKTGLLHWQAARAKK
jgi:hypothetical protein